MRELSKIGKKLQFFFLYSQEGKKDTNILYTYNTLIYTSAFTYKLNNIIHISSQIIQKGQVIIALMHAFPLKEQNKALF
jgi:hypothetical protein